MLKKGLNRRDQMLFEEAVKDGFNVVECRKMFSLEKPVAERWFEHFSGIKPKTKAVPKKNVKEE